MQGILHSTHSNEGAVKGIGHTSDYAPTIKGGIVRRIQIHPRMMSHPFSSAKLRGDLARHLLRMGKNRKEQNLLKQGDEIAQHRSIQIQGELAARLMRSVQNNIQVPGSHAMGPENRLQFLPQATAIRHFFLFFCWK